MKRRTLLALAASTALPGLRALALSTLAIVPALAPATSQAADFPTKPINLVVPFAPGGPTDAMARSLAMALRSSLGQPVIVDNRAGAGGVTGTDAIAKATDGHTFGFGSPAPLVTNPMLMKKMPYDAENAF